MANSPKVEPHAYRDYDGERSRQQREWIPMHARPVA